MKKLRFFKCVHCGNVVVKLVDKNVPVFCCGQKMEEIVANTTDGAVEKHLPVMTLNGKILEVKIGEIAHPMQEEHYINFVVVEFENEYVVSVLSPASLPETNIYVGDKKVVAVYEYCNLHGLWKVEI